jgi:hypothetical protein
MPKIIKINESSFKKLFEYVGDEEEFGRYDIDPDKYNMSDEEYDSLKKQIGDEDNFEDELKSLYDDLEAEQFIGQDYYDPGPYEEYKGMF